MLCFLSQTGRKEKGDPLNSAIDKMTKKTRDLRRQVSACFHGSLQPNIYFLWHKDMCMIFHFFPSIPIKGHGGQLEMVHWSVPLMVDAESNQNVCSEQSSNVLKIYPRSCR